MRTFCIVIFVGTLLVPSSFAATEDVVEGMGRKAWRGAVNVLTGIIEVPAQVYKGCQNSFEPIESRVWSKTVGGVLGFFRGLSHAAGRLSWGALELAGFWTANHPDNEGVGVPFDAQYPWEEGIQYSVFEPSFSEGIKPVGGKLLRGLADTAVAIAEIPCQTLEGGFEGNFFQGFGRGLWFGLSRGVYGFTGIMTSLVPNPQDNPGYPLNGEWPWSVLNELSED